MANHFSGAERHNRKLNKTWESAKENERVRVAAGYRPNPNLTDMSTITRKRFKVEDHVKEARTKALENKKK
jgi:hypothetical protein